MLRNYLRISLRNLQKDLSYSLINISGLGLGLATCLLLITWIADELSYDRFHERASAIYRVSLEYSFGGQVSKTSVSPTALSVALMSLPETETAVRIYNPSEGSGYIVRNDEKVFEENRFYFADSTFFGVFSFRVARGNPSKALSAPYSVMITETTAKKYFGKEDPIGRSLFVNNNQDYKVTGVLEDPPSNSIIQFDFLASFSSLSAAREAPIWWTANYQTFVLAHEGADVRALSKKINEIATKAVAEDLSGKYDYVRYNFLPLADIHLRDDAGGSPGGSDIRYVYIFSAVAMLILIVACINYINLATARAAGRAKEVGIRKVSGAQRKQLIAQFIGESFVITGIAFALALLVGQLVLPFFNELTGKHFSYHDLANTRFVFFASLALPLLAFAAGIYPALALTSFDPVKVLKGNFSTSRAGSSLRKSLVVIQFGISVVLITATLIIVKQMTFIHNKNLGFDRENTIVLPLDQKTDEVYEALKTELIRTGAAIEVGRASESPANVNAGYSINTTDREGRGIITRGLLADEGFVPALGMTLVSGRNFTKDDLDRMARDTVFTFILNEAALSALYLKPEEAVGTQVKLQGQKGEIIGVVKDFHFSSLHNPITPMTMFPAHRFRKIFIKLPAGDVSEKIAGVSKVCGTLITHRPFDYEFLDQQYASLYQSETRMQSIAVVFATLSVAIACLGLFGLVAFSAGQKRKEMGIRKVLGATATGIVFLIARDFARLVVVATVAGLPVAYWIMSTYWLNGFVYKTEIGAAPFFVASALSVVIALVTTAYQAVKASRVNPADILRSE